MTVYRSSSGRYREHIASVDAASGDDGICELTCLGYKLNVLGNAYNLAYRDVGDNLIKISIDAKRLLFQVEWNGFDYLRWHDRDACTSVMHCHQRALDNIANRLAQQKKLDAVRKARKDGT